MDEASQLVSELQTRLKELDHKVWLYRRDMTSEYTKYAEELLRDVPADISDKVQQAIVASMKSYRSLNPEPYDDAIESCAVGVGNDNAANGLHKNAPIPFGPSTPDSPFGTTEDENEIPRSPHEREKEFTGLFTPSFLPLLDSSHQRRLSTDKQASPSLDKGKGREFGSMGVDASTQSSRSLTATPDLSRPTPPATPKRRNTDEASVKSDSSDGPIRRSALRRSSSSSRIQSPRHVRFQFEGKEVLPTASPSTEPVLPQDTSSNIFGNDDDSDEEGGAEQVEDIDDPPPKRISSSQALRALSRGPLEDDGTKWIEVSDFPSTNGSSRESSSEDIKLTNGGGLRIITPEETTSMSTNGNGIPESNTQDDATNDGADDSSEDEMLAIGSRKSKKPIPTPVVDSNKETKLEQESKSIDAEPLPEKHLAEPVKHDVKQEKKESEGGLKFDEDYDDVLFQFDEHANEEGLRPPPEEEQESDAESDVTATEEPAINLSAYSQSPARPIPWPKESTPTSPSRSSYRGHPFSESIVKDEDLHAKMASLGDMQSFVGSVNGRSGFDESNALSFRESLNYGSGGNFSGTPRSMSERMMLDDLMEAEEARAK